MFTPRNEHQIHLMKCLCCSLRPSILSAGGLILCLLLGMYSTGLAKQAKVDVCHRPPGNPSKHKILSIGASALPDHQSHGDNLVGPEICDGIDNNCDGTVDEGIPDIVSGSDVGVCQPEIQACISGGFQVVQAAITPTTEICDALDNDCNAKVDDGISTLVSGSNVGACQEEIQQCQGGQFVVTQVEIGPTTETCDAVDNDCNGIADDGVPSIAQGSDVGACQPEIQECQGGQLVVTQAAIEPTPETCNDVDDNCNGTVDEGIDEVQTGTDEGECKKGISECEDGVLVVVQTEIEPSLEICDGKDNDCDGTTDGADANSDCDDGVSCTNESCVAGNCENIPDDSQCNGLLVCNVDLGCIIDEGDPGDGGCNTLVCDEEPPVVVPPIATPPVAGSADDDPVVESPDSNTPIAESPVAESPISAEPVENRRL